MNKIITLIAAIVISASAFCASNTTSKASSFDQINGSYSPQVCQFSLTCYRGVVTGDGYSSYFKVGLSCPQETDAYATVVAYVDDLPAASLVVKVEAGKTESENVRIPIGRDYTGKNFRLLVQ